ncbi:MAG: very short patch repair endonuclease [Albidovulum sp.]|nr:very short patch repair endonuclease [Albidovulum sp.]
MVDFVSQEMRSKIMRGVKSVDTKPEMLVRRAMHRLGYRFRIHRKDLPGKPDIVLPRHNLVVFVHGCFWHQHSGCKDGRMPSSNTEFWEQKFSANRARDAIHTAALMELGWRVEVIWECQTLDPGRLSARLAEMFAPID